MMLGRFAIFRRTAVALGIALLGATHAAAEGDGPYAFNEVQEFENNYARYKTNDGYVTNFDKELFPINPFGNDGKLYFRREKVPIAGTGGSRLEPGQTNLQLQFKF